ncbi:MAG: hypothetical protein ABIR06_02415 [Cyclobacteriaceae bacterium]
MVRIFFLIFLALGLKTFSYGQNFSGQVYLLSESFLEERCQVLIEADDCPTDLIFLTDKTFAMVNRCLANDTYYVGNYVKKKNLLRFTFKPVMAREVYDAETDRKKYEKTRLKIDPIEFTISQCAAGRFTLEHTPIKEYKYGSRLSGQRAREKIIKLKIAKGWKMISG